MEILYYVFTSPTRQPWVLAGDWKYPGLIVDESPDRVVFWERFMDATYSQNLDLIHHEAWPHYLDRRV